jgi:glucose-1-phosphate cytidylyltransferase
MRVAILAGGFGTRLAEETDLRPKPMVEIGGRPILWHILKHYERYGCREFSVALGYKGEYVKRFFLEYAGLMGSLSIDLASGSVDRLERQGEDWQVHLVDTGVGTNTGGRILRLAPWLRRSTFQLTYGDGVSDVDLDALVRFHRRMGRVATLTAVRPPARYGGLTFDGDDVVGFSEKPQAGEGWINGGFMVCEPALFDYLDGDETSLEYHVLERLALEGQLAAYRHPGFWQCMDTLRDKRLLEKLWNEGRAPWAVREDDLPTSKPRARRVA